MRRVCVRLLLRSFRIAISVFLVVIGVYVIIMHRVTQDHSRDFSTVTKLVPKQQLQQLVTFGVTEHSNATTLRWPSNVAGNHDNALPATLQHNTSRLLDNAAGIATTVRVDAGSHGNGTSDDVNGNTSGNQSSSLLAGTPGSTPVYLSIGIPTLKREKGDYFFSTLASLLNQSSPAQQRELTLVVILADRDQAYNSVVLQRIKDTYPQQLKSGLLLAVSAPDTEHLYQNDNLKRTYNDNIHRVRWRSKQNLDYAALMEFCTPLSTYYLQIEDDVLAAPNYVQHIHDFIQINAAKPWAGLEVCPHGFIGKLFRTADLPKLVSVLRVFYLEMPCDFLIHHFYNLMLQKNIIRRKGTLFFHQGKYSSLGNVTRKVDPIPQVKAVAKVSQGHINPPANLYTSIRTYKKFELKNAYNTLSNQYFWGSEVQEGDSVTVVFIMPCVLDSIVIETGFPGEEGRDKARNATVEIGQSVDFDQSFTNALCTDTHVLGEFKDGRFEAKVNATIEVKCISIVITQSQHEWLVIREIAVYPRLAIPK